MNMVYLMHQETYLKIQGGTLLMVMKMPNSNQMTRQDFKLRIKLDIRV